MSMTDPIADLLTRIRNALRIRRSKVLVAKSKMNKGIIEVLKREGYIKHYEETDGMSKQGMYTVHLKYGPDGEELITFIQRVSKPGCRRHEKIGDLRTVINGLGIHILSTSKGILSDREARNENVGGEVLCTVW